MKHWDQALNEVKKRNQRRGAIFATMRFIVDEKGVVRLHHVKSQNLPTSPQELLIPVIGRDNMQTLDWSSIRQVVENTLVQKRNGLARVSCECCIDANGVVWSARVSSRKLNQAMSADVMGAVYG